MGNLATQTAERLRDAILKGEYRVGQPLREVEICRALGVSRIPLREALHRLVGERIVVIRPNRGAEVAQLSKADLREIAEACRLLEGHLLALAAPQLCVEILDRAEESLELLDREDNPAEWSRINWVFHATLHAAAQRPLLVELVGGLRARAELAMLKLVAEKERRLALNREHREILEGLRRGSADRAVKQLDKHLLHGKEDALRLLDP
jgi:DNA-binding GntR family transcriptional regulator